MKKRLLLMTSILALCVAGISGCGSSSTATEIPKLESLTEKDNATVSEKTFKYDVTLDDSGKKYAKVADNGDYEMYLDDEAVSFCVKQKSTNEIFNTALIPEDHGSKSDDINPKSLERYRSPLQITYYNKTKDSAATVSTYLTDFKFAKSGIKTYELKEDNKVVGFRAEYPIASQGKNDDINITVSVDYKLTDDGFDVTLPVDCVKEEGDYGVTKITVLPFFESGSDTEDGYFFYPDGSGAVMEFKDSSHNGEQPVSYTVYGNLENYKNMLGQWDEEDSYVFMPVYGANVENKSYTAIVEAGEETSTITVTPGTNKDPFNHLNSTFEFRKSFKDQRYATAGSDKTVLTFDSELTNVERKVSYHLFKAGEDTQYDDMAVCYREYLTDTLGVKKTDDVSDNIPVSIDFFMGIKEDGLIFDTFQAVTTFEQVGEMIDELNQNGVESVEAQLKGWTKDGYYTDPVQFPVNSKIGGKKGLANLTEKYKDNKEVKITLETNLLEANEKADGYNVNTDTITLGNYMVLNNNNKYLLSPNVSYGLFKDMVKNADKNKASDINGYSFYSVGQYLLYNYNSNNTLNLTQGKKIWQDMLAENEKTYGTTIVQGGNQYVLGSADKITDIPYEDSGYRITTKSVPVYQIALHGLVEFTGEPGNLSSDITEEKLKWAEYGYMPYFELTYSSSDKLMYTDYNELFSSEFKTWMDEVVSVYETFNEQLCDVWNAYIVGHEEVATDVYKVTYDNGKSVYVNYTDKEYQTKSGDIVDAQSFVVVDK